jgi:CRISPR-associated protein Csm5
MNGQAVANKTTVKLTITTLSPLHVGSGDRLREGFDFLDKDGYLWIASQRRLLDAILDEAEESGQSDAQVIQAITGMTLYDLLDAGWLDKSYFDPKRKLFSYRLRGQTSTTHKEGELHEEIKDVYGRPYLPGSTLKGALRTMLAWDDLTTRNRTVRARDLNRSPKFAAQPVEKDIFGCDPNHDLLRALVVRDSDPMNVDDLGLAQATLTPASEDREKLTIDMEAIRPGVTIGGELLLDEFLLQDRRTARLELHDYREWLHSLARVGQRYSRQRVQEEIAFHKASGATRETLLFYARLVKMMVEKELAADEWIMQIGWGAGWDSKTFDGALREDEAEFVRIVNKYDLHLGPGGDRNQNAKFKAGDVFPVTRKLMTMRTAGALRQPPGWIRIKAEVMP